MIGYCRRWQRLERGVKWKTNNESRVVHDRLAWRQEECCVCSGRGSNNCRFKIGVRDIGSTKREMRSCWRDYHYGGNSRPQQQGCVGLTKIDRIRSCSCRFITCSMLMGGCINQTSMHGMQVIHVVLWKCVFACTQASIFWINGTRSFNWTHEYEVWS